MSRRRVFISGPNNPEALPGSFAGSLIAALEQVGVETYYHYLALTPHMDQLALRSAISLRPVSIMLLPPSDGETAASDAPLSAEWRFLRAITAFNPTRIVLSIPLEHATPDTWSALYIPDCLAVQDGVTSKTQDHIIKGICDLLALSLPLPPVDAAAQASDDSLRVMSRGAIAPASARDQLTLSKALNLQGAHREAEEILHRLTTGADQSAGVWTNLGYTYMLLEEWSEAAEASRHAFELLERTTSKRCLGTSLLALGQYEDACAAFRRALAIHSSYGAAWLGLGKALLALGRHEEAREAFERVENLKPDNPWAYEDQENVIQVRKYLENLG